MTETESSTAVNEGADDDQALLERLARREERRQKRMKEAMERQKELDPTIGTTNGTDVTLEEQTFISISRQQNTEEEEEEKKEEEAACFEYTSSVTIAKKKHRLPLDSYI